MNVLRGIGIGLISSGVAVGLVLFFVRHYLSRLISYEFEKRSVSYSVSADRRARVADFLIDTQMGIYPEILELVYRLRNIMKEGIEHSGAHRWSADLRPLCAHLTENLYKYRLFLPQDQFDALHEFKQISQEALLLVDMQTRPDRLFDDDGYRQTLSVFEPRYERANALYEQIATVLARKFGVK